MKKKNLEINVVDSLTVSGTVISTVQPAPNEKPIVKTFKLSDSTDEIVTGTIRDLEESGYKFKPQKIRVLKETIDRGKQWGAGWKIGLHVTGIDFERTPSQETKTSMEMTYEIVKEEDSD
jgi:hypothetical protein